MTLTISNGECYLEDKFADDSKMVDALLKKMQQSEKKLELCKAAMQTIIDHSGEFATKQLLSGVLEKVK